METQQHCSIRVADLTPVVMSWGRFGLPKQRQVPREAEGNVFDTNDWPSTLHCSLHVTAVRIFARFCAGK